MDELIKFPNLERVLMEFGEELKDQYQKNLVKNDRVATHNLLDSVEFILKKGMSSYTVSLNLADYWVYVENGRGPTKSSGNGELRRAILDWINAKPVLPHPDKNGNLPTPQQLAYLISRKIHREGTEGTHDLRNATEDIYGNFQERIYEAIEKDVDEALIKIFLY